MVFVRLALIVIGTLFTLAGLVWIGQGSGYFPYPAASFMINQSPWVLRGALTAIVGIIIIVAGRRFAR
jgi:hypothetical protein